jgi:DNA-binding MarR family transcriptional regulator
MSSEVNDFRLFFRLSRSERDTLLALSRIGGCSGQDVSRFIDDLRGRDAEIKTTVYLSLNRLAEKGFVSYETDDNDGRANRYRLTRKGETAVMDGMAAFRCDE